MIQSNIQSPGVYINEQNAFPNSVIAVPTAVPAFIGYTPQAFYAGKSYTNVPTKITSLAEFRAIFCYPDPASPARPAKQYSPEYYVVQQNARADDKNDMLINNVNYSILPDPNTIYYLYNSIKLFYMNGGGDAYIVSVGTYGPPSHQPMTIGTPMINPNVVLAELEAGLALLLNEQEPTMYICPEATLLSVAENAILMQSMLAQSQQMQTAICIFDIIGARNPDPVRYTEDIATFRSHTGDQGLNYGVAYYPFVCTTIMDNQDTDYTNLFGGNVQLLEPLLNPASNPDPAAASVLSKIQNPSGSPLSVDQYHTQLLLLSRTYKLIIDYIVNDINILPPSGGMAGVMTLTDSQSGVWQAPANTSITGVVDLTIKISDSQQSGLSIDPVSGKSVNAIRSLNGAGILVWGARTLDANSQDWRYISVRRMMIMLEQSCKLAAQAYVFQPNVKNTWEAVKAMINSFLNTVWTGGGLQGAKSADAFSVACGLGITMTAEEVLNGIMNVVVQVAIVHPGEFMVITIRQEMATSS